MKTWITPAATFLASLWCTLTPAATRTWLGGQPGNSWHDPSNWDAGIVPGAFDNVVVAQASGNLVVTTDATVANLSLAAGTSLTVAGPNARLRASGTVILNGSALRSEDGGQVDFPQADSLEAGLISIHGTGSISVPSLRQFNNSSVELTDGGFWAMPAGVTNLSFQPYLGSTRGGPIQVSGVGSHFDGRSLLALTLVPGGGGGQNDGANFTVNEQGEVDLSRLVRLIVTSGNVALASITVSSNAVIRLDSLEFIGGSGNGPGIAFRVEARAFEIPHLEEIGTLTKFTLAEQGSLRLPKLLRAKDSVFIIPSGARLEAELLADLTACAVELDGSGEITAPNLRNIDNSRFSVTGGAQLEIPAKVTSYFWEGEQVHPSNRSTAALFSATGTSSRIIAPGLETITANNSVHLLQPSLVASDQGLVDLPNLQRITANLVAYFDQKGTFEIRATGGADVRIPKLAEVLGSGPCGHVNCSTKGILFDLGTPFVELAMLEDIRIPSEFRLPTNGVLRIPISELLDARVTVPEGGKFDAPLLRKFLGGSMSLSGSASFAADNLSDLSGTHIAVRAGARYSIPDVITNLDTSLIASEFYLDENWLFADGPGSQINGSSVRSLKGHGKIEANAGGMVRLPGVVRIDSVNGLAIDFATTDGGLTTLDSLVEVGESDMGLGTRFWPSGDLTLNNLRSFDGGAFYMKEGRQLSLPSLTKLQHVLLPIRIDSRVVAPQLSLASDCRIEMDRFTIFQVGSLRLKGGQLNGVGMVDGSVVNQGTVQPGNPFGEPYGVLTITGDFSQVPNETSPTDSSGTLLVVVGGRTAKGFLDVQGRASLGGRLKVELRDNYDPRAGVTNEIAHWGNATGGIWSLVGAGYGPGLEFQLKYTPSTMQLVTASAAAPTVLSMAPSRRIARPLASFDIAFSEVLDPTSFRNTGLALFGPDGQLVAMDEPVQVGQVIWRIGFPVQTNAGPYEITVLPTVRDAAGNAMATPFVHRLEVTPPDLGPGTPPTISRENGQLLVEFEGALESSSSVLGPWIPVPAASSPYRVSPESTAVFFRAW